ncbi:MAG: HNH endonuclease signature motif containing protein [Bacteroidota bacterium]
MSKTYISLELRRRVTKRADDTCEYCRIPLTYGFFLPYHIDHIISEKHGGATTYDNLAFACKSCNSFKGSDLATFLAKKKIIVRIYHPRKDNWSDHFSLNEMGELIPHTDIGTATIQLLDLNIQGYCTLRRVLLAGKVKLIPNQ